MEQPSWQWDATRRDYYYWDPADNCYFYQTYGRVYPDQNNSKYVLTKVERGTAEQLTEPRALLSGFRSYRRVEGRAGDAERLDPRYVRHYPGRDFYKVGRVFKVLWPESTGNAQSGVTFATGAYNEPIYNKIRWFIVIREGRDACTCLSIQTYNRQGVAKPGVDKAQHSVVFTGSYSPEVPEWEDPHGKMLQSIPIVATDPTQAKMDSMARLNYAKLYTVEHNVKALEFGDVAPGWTDIMRQNFLSVQQREADNPFKASPIGPSPQSSFESNRGALDDTNLVHDQLRSEGPRQPTEHGFIPSETRSPETLQQTSSPAESSKELPDQLTPPPMHDHETQVTEELGDAEGLDRGQAFSDSGYHSGNGTDTASVCSIWSSGSSLGIPMSFLENVIADFGDNLIQKAGVRAWAPYALANHTTAEIEAHLDHLLKHYAIELEELVSSLYQRTGPMNDGKLRPEHNSSREERAIRIIRQYRLKIALYIRQNALSTKVPNTSMLSHILESGIQLSLGEKLKWLAKPRGLQEEDPDFDEEVDDELDEDEEDEKNEDEEDEEDYIANISATIAFLLTGSPFKRLMNGMRRILYRDDRSQMRHIEEVVTKSVFTAETENGVCSSCFHDATVGKTISDPHCACCSAGRIHRTSYSVEWDPIEFLVSEYDDPSTPLGNVLVLSGSGLYGHATTCVDYIHSVWPNTGNILLPLLHESFRNPAAHLQVENEGSISIKVETRWLKNHEYKSLRIELDATIGFTVEIAQQISWLATALRVGLSGATVSYSEPLVTKESSPEPDLTCFRISVIRRPLHSTETSCWFSLFSGAGIACGFPIPDRESESGLEIPIEILAALAGVRHAVEFQGGVVLKGFSTMFVPTERTEDRIRWHFVRDDGGKFLTYENGVQQCPQRLMVTEVDLDALQSTKTFVGWCSAAKLFLGSEAINYENLHYSGHHLEKPGSHINLAGGSVGFSQFATAQLNVTFGAKDGKCHFERNSEMYDEIISMADDMRVLLCDTGEKRAWFMSATPAILHIAQARHQTGFFGINNRQAKLFSKDTSECSARETLVRDANNMIVPDESYSLRKLVLDIWLLLDILNNNKEPSNPNQGIEPTRNFREELYGFEFRDVVRKKSPCELKRYRVSKTNGGWVDLVQDTGALTLFANGFEDLIKPSDECQNLCRHWQSLPKEHDYLAVTVRMLKDLYEVAGCPLDRKFLSSSRLR